jgi:hypothetical protein
MLDRRCIICYKLKSAVSCQLNINLKWRYKMNIFEALRLVENTLSLRGFGETLQWWLALSEL